MQEMAETLRLVAGSFETPSYAYDEGWDTALEGLAPACPYQPGTSLERAWYAGMGAGRRCLQDEVGGPLQH